MRRLLILLLSLTLFAAACGDDSADDGGDDDTTTAGDDDDGGDDDGGDDDDAGDDDAGDDDAGDDDAGDDDAGDDDAGDDDDGGDDAGFGSGSGSDFCDLWNDDTDDFGTDSLDFMAGPDELEDAVNRNLEALDSVRQSAPSEIRDDLDVIYDNFSGVAEVLEANDWDMFAASEDMTDLDSDATTQATENIDAFCGTEPDDDDIGGIGGIDPTDVLDPDLVDDLENVDPDDAEAMGLLIWQSLGHDEETAQCLLDEFGTFDDFPEDPGPEFMTQEFCGMTMIQIMTGG